jgi:hypothetical protein
VGQLRHINRLGGDTLIVLSESAHLSMKNNCVNQPPDFASYLLAIPKTNQELSPDSVLAEPLVLGGKANIKLRELGL